MRFTARETFLLTLEWLRTLQALRADNKAEEASVAVAATAEAVAVIQEEAEAAQTTHAEVHVRRERRAKTNSLLNQIEKADQMVSLFFYFLSFGNSEEECRANAGNALNPDFSAKLFYIGF